MATKNQSPKTVVIPREIFDMYWSSTTFYTTGEGTIFYKTLHELSAQKLLDGEVLWIIHKAFGSSKARDAMSEIHKTPVRAPTAQQRKYLNMVEMIKKSQYRFFLVADTDKLLTGMRQALPEHTIAKEMAKPLIKSNNPIRFIVGLSLLDVIPATKRSNYTESFFACVLSAYFKQIHNRPNWKMVSKLIAMCFRKEMSDPEQSCRDLNYRFPKCRSVASSIIALAMKNGF
jgi:hypothetical protein